MQIEKVLRQPMGKSSSGGTNRGGASKEEIKKGEPSGQGWGNQRGRGTEPRL